MDILTFDITPNAKAVKMASNGTSDNFNIAVILIDNICNMVLEADDDYGINVIMNNGQKHTIKPNDVTRVGVKTYTHQRIINGFTFLVCDDGTELLQDILDLCQF